MHIVPHVLPHVFISLKKLLLNADKVLQWIYVEVDLEGGVALVLQHLLLGER